VAARSLNKIVDAGAGKLLKGSETISVSRVSHGLAQTQAGDLFIALRGWRFDGHEFLNRPRARRDALLIEQKRFPQSYPKVRVVSRRRHPQSAWQNRRRLSQGFSLPIIAVGGLKAVKTTTKDLIASVLRQKISTLHSDAVVNNDIGVPSPCCAWRKRSRPR